MGWLAIASIVVGTAAILVALVVTELFSESAVVRSDVSRTRIVGEWETRCDVGALDPIRLKLMPDGSATVTTSYGIHDGDWLTTDRYEVCVVYMTSPDVGTTMCWEVDSAGVEDVLLIPQRVKGEQSWVYRKVSW